MKAFFSGIGTFLNYFRLLNRSNKGLVWATDGNVGKSRTSTLFNSFIIWANVNPSKYSSNVIYVTAHFHVLGSECRFFPISRKTMCQFVFDKFNRFPSSYLQHTAKLSATKINASSPQWALGLSSWLLIWVESSVTSEIVGRHFENIPNDCCIRDTPTWFASSTFPNRLRQYLVFIIIIIIIIII